MITKKRWTAAEDVFVRENFDKALSCNLGTIITRSSGAIRHRAKFLGLTRNKERNRVFRSLVYRKYKVNHDYFEVIDTPEKAYWLGFMWADGCLDGNGRHNKLKLSLEISDRSTVEAFAKAIETDAPIKDRINNKKYTKKNGDKCYASTLEVSSCKMFNDLINLNITQRKSYGHIEPIGILDEYLSHFVRGVFDGDGCISEDSTTNNYMVGFTGTKVFCEWLKEKLAFVIETGGSVCKSKPIGESYTYSLGGRLQLERFATWLYENANGLFLNRKFEKFKEFALI